MDTFLIEDTHFKKILKLIKIFLFSNVILQILILSTLIFLLFSLNNAFNIIGSNIEKFNQMLYIDDAEDIKDDVIKIIKFICNATNAC